MINMKMLYILNTTNKVNNFSYSSMLAAQELGIEFHIAGNWTGYTNSDDKKADEKKYGITIHQIDFIRNPYNPKNFKAYYQVVKLIKKEQFDMIHCNTPIGGIIGRLAGKKCKVKKIIYQAHGFHFYKGSPKKNWLIYYPIERWLAHYTDILITINSEDYELSKTKFKLHNGGKVYYIPGVGIDLTQYELPDNVRKIKRTELGLKETDIALISAGELNENKNNKIIIQALSELKNNNIHYIICGVGPKYSELKKIVSDNNLDDFVHFLGYRNDIKELYKACDIFVMPSFREGLSRSIMEAMASGLPCVVSKIRGNVDLIHNSKLLCKPNSVNDFVQAITELISSKETRTKIVETNHNTLGKYSIKEVISYTISIYEKCIIQ